MFPISRWKCCSLLALCLLSFCIAPSQAQVTTCCDFSSAYPCTFNTVQNSWEFAPGSTPNTLSYPEFLPLDAYYAWIQDKSGSMLSVSEFTISSTSSSFSFDYYFDTLDPLPGDYLRVIFNPSGYIGGVEIAGITIAEDLWRHYVGTCDNSANFCCGSISNFPCTGTLQIIASLDVDHNTGLFGIDNLCGDGSITTVSPKTPTVTTPKVTTPSTTRTTSTPYPITLPPPVPPTGCCHFDTNVCAFYDTVPYWYWSRNSPTSEIPPKDTYDYYLYTNVNGATVQSASWGNIDWSTTFYLNYYINLYGAELIVSFVQAGYGPQVVATLANPGVWTSFAISAISGGYIPWCQGTQPCTGSLQIEFSGAADHYAAIDDTGINGACSGSLPCCYFDDPGLCGFTLIGPVPPVTTNGWKWSYYHLPAYHTIPAPSPPSDYVFFETNNYIGTAYTDSLQSAPFVVSIDAVFEGNFYVDTDFDESGANSLLLNFEVDGVATPMDFLRDTSGKWILYTFMCKSVHGDCCQSKGQYCEGKLLLTASVGATGGTVIYAVDAIEIDGQCTTFPGLTMKSKSGESEFIPMKPQSKK